MKSFTWKVLICVVPILIGILVVGRAFSRYRAGEGGFNLGVDLVGGTILVYEIDESRWPEGKKPDDYSVQKLAAKLKQRIDPADLYNITIRPVGDTRIEIILPTGGRKQAEAQAAAWDKVVQEVKDRWPPKEGHEDAYNVPIDQKQKLVAAVIESHQPKEGEPFDAKAVEDFISAKLPQGDKRRHMTTERVQEVKELISRVGSLKFVILANDHDDKEAIDAARDFFVKAKGNAALEERLHALALLGQPPPKPEPPDGSAFHTNLGDFTYSWIELGKYYRVQMHLDNASENDASPIPDKDDRPTSTPKNAFWQELAAARAKGEPFSNGRDLFYSRKVENPDRLPEKDRDKKFEYFVLTRDPERDPETGKATAVTGEYLIDARPKPGEKGGIEVAFNFNSIGARLFGDLTTKNKPEGGFERQLAIVLDDLVESAPNIHSPITGGDGVITGNYTMEEATKLSDILRSGALPATLKPQPVSENTMGATLGEDTIRWGTISVLVAFAAVLLFMLVYYRFAGIVACIALLANLILTVAMMVLINATFTLPGLAGLVLMLGMAVDANVLIYERLREERERGASLALAIRNGYERALPTIIDTHLSSIFTAIVLYVVGNDQLKGFGISLTLGLIISLFTSLFMTHVIFNFWLAKGWLHKLNMMKLFSKPNIDFMGIRYYWFTATIVLTVIGAIIFFYRLDHGGLNIDFVGGTAYGGLLQPGDAMTVTQMQEALDPDRKENKEKLAVEKVEPLDDRGNYRLVYADGTSRQVFVDKQKLSNGETGLVPEDEVKDRAEHLPGLSVEQTFATGYTEENNKSRLFTVRTTEKAADLVQAAIARLLGGKLQQITMTDFAVSAGGKEVAMNFSDFASPAQVSTLLERQFKETEGMSDLASQFTLERVGKDQQGRYKEMKLVISAPGTVNRAKLEGVVKQVQDELASRPQPERLENFDAQLATDTQLRALYAILASWGAILLYLWFRFGSWTFGLAAVLCLIHDLFFTLGWIGIAHYLHGTWLGNLLLIQDFKLDLNSVAALLTLVGYSVSDTIVVFDRIREVRGKNPELTPKMINDSVNQTLSRTLLRSLSVWLVVLVLYVIGGEGVHLFAFVMVIGVVVGTYSSIYIASPLLLIFGEGKPSPTAARQPVPQRSPA